MSSSIDIFTSSATVEWGTPRDVVAGLIAAGFDLRLDVCATPGREVVPAYYCPPIEMIGQYKVTKGPEKGQIKIDEAFKRKALEYAINVRAPLAIDALAQDWAGDLLKLGPGACGFENPPFGHAIKAFMRKTWEEANKGACIVGTIPSRTGTSWWHDFIEPVRLGKFPGMFDFWKGRMSFIDMDGKTTTPAPFDMAIVVWDGRKL